MFAQPATFAPYCGPGVAPVALWATWNLDPWLLLGLAAFAAATFAPALRRRAGLAPPDRREALALAAGHAVLVLAFVSPLCALSSSLFSARIGHHMLMIAVAAPLLVAGGATRLLVPERPDGAPPRLSLTAATLIHAALLWLWHAPLPYAWALASPALYWLMELSLLGSALLFWDALARRREAVPAVLLTLVTFMAQMGLLAAILTFAPQPLYAFHLLTTADWGLTPLEDQQLAGLVMWVPGSVPYAVAGLLALAGWLNRRQLQERDGAA